MKKVLAIIAVFLVICCSMIPCFADGSGFDFYDDIRDRCAFHQGYQIIQGDLDWVNIWSFDNTFTKYDGDDSRYLIESTNYTFNDVDYRLSTFVYPPVSEVLGSTLRQEHYLDMASDITIHFNAFVPYFTDLDAYVVSALGSFDCEIVLNYAYVDGLEIKSDTITWSYDDVRSVNILNGLSGNVLYIESLDVIFSGGYMFDWLNIYCPVGSDSASSIDDLPYNLYSAYEVKEVDFVDGIFGWLDDFLEIKLFGDFGLGHLVGIMITICCAIWVLKIVAGG